MSRFTCFSRVKLKKLGISSIFLQIPHLESVCLKSVFKEGGTAPQVRDCAGKLESRSSVATCRWRLFHINLYLYSQSIQHRTNHMTALNLSDGWSYSTWITNNLCFSRKLVFELIRGNHLGTTLLKPALKNSLCPRLFSGAFLRFDSLFLYPAVEEAPSVNVDA